MIRAELPWPPTALRPNASSPGNWRKKHTAAQFYKSLCVVELRNQGIGKMYAELLHLTLTFCAPDNHRRDLDNMLAAVKHGIDAVAHVTGVDDYHYGLTLARGPVTKGGRVIVEIIEA